MQSLMVGSGCMVLSCREGLCVRPLLSSPKGATPNFVSSTQNVILIIYITECVSVKNINGTLKNCAYQNWVIFFS